MFYISNENQLFEPQPAPEEPRADSSSQEQPGAARRSQRSSQEQPGVTQQAATATHSLPFSEKRKTMKNHWFLCVPRPQRLQQACLQPSKNREKPLVFVCDRDIQAFFQVSFQDKKVEKPLVFVCPQATETPPSLQPTNQKYPKNLDFCESP